MADPDFVGRTDIMEEILGGGFFDVEGIPGIGKTRLLSELFRRKLPKDVVIRIDGEHFEASHGRMRSPASEEQAELRQFRRLLGDALESVPDDEKIADVIKYLSDYSPSAQGGERADFVHDPDEVLERAIGAANHLGRTLAATQARFLVLLDNFHLLAGRPLGQWVLDWLSGLRGADIVLTHQEYKDDADPGLPARAVRLQLGNLSREDVEACLTSHPDIGPDVAGIVGQVWDFTGGYPDALALVADLTRGCDSHEAAARLIQQLAALQGGPAAQLRGLVRRILDIIHDEELRDTLYSVCVTRHFDGPLIELLMKVDESRAQTLIDRLMHYSFVRKSTGEYSYFAVSDFVRSVVGEERLGPARTQTTHAIAERYYQRRITTAVEEDESSYQSWLHYERPAFQALERDWLYHLSRLTGTHRQAGRLGIARIFLDTFWWWGSYMPFRFCEQILDDWSDATSSSEEDRAWGTLLRSLYDTFPKGWRLDTIPADTWTEVRLTLRRIMDLGHFGQAREYDEEMRHIRGILDCYLTDAERHADPGSPEADELLNDAAEQFTALNDEWNTAWVEFYRADLAIGRDQGELAISLAKASAARHPDLDDDELVANLHRVCADAHWLSEPGKALDAHARAVLHAYRFQIKDVQDDYTEAFQREMIERAMDRLVAWHEDAQDTQHAELRLTCARIRAFFGPYWQPGASSPAGVGLEVIQALDQHRPEDAAGMLFPALPTLLGYHDTPYAQTCGDVTHKMRNELAEPPDTPLPPAEA